MAIKKKTLQKRKGQAQLSESAQLQPPPAPRGRKKSVEAQEAAQLESAAFPIVGIGASAGGLAAFEAFFSGMPIDADPGMAFVLVQHLAPDHKSILPDLIQHYTRLQVFEVEDGMAVKPNCAYIIPPNCDMAFMHGTLQLLDPSVPRGHRLPIDFFFRSLAQDQHERAICIVLSGTGSDGTAGVRAIKGEGGMVMVQNPESAEYDGMPRSAIATGMVDFELPPAEMPAQLISYVGQAFGKLPRLTTASASGNENALKKILVLLRSHSGHDFSGYKPSTINRRIERRMAVQQIDTMDRYIKFLQQTPAETEALFRDLLIGVTSFFRDPEAFMALEEKAIPQLFADKPADFVLRVWIPGCSSGEEAYSIAILLQEYLDTARQSCKVQLFASDIDSQAIAFARAGIYPASIAADISPERLARFFNTEADGSMYRIHKAIRDMIVFSEQDIIKDPPFSRIDLLSCRNLLIYMDGPLQKKLIPLFHYVMNPGGILFLGTSETVGEFIDLFAALNRKLKIYQRQEVVHNVQNTTLSRYLPPGMVSDSSIPGSAGKMTTMNGKFSLRELTELTLLEQVSPTAILVNKHGDILYLHGRAGAFLELNPGETGINNVLKMAREGLRHVLLAALAKAAMSREIVRHSGLRVTTNGGSTLVNLAIHPVTAIPLAQTGTPLLLINLEEEAPVTEPAQTKPGADRQSDSETDTAAAGIDTNRQIVSLKQELQAKEEYLRTTTEELETSNEELKSSNEEMQSVNEELQSTNEELETSKEELQSVNEELATVNAELQTKVADLSRANNDMNNLLAGTGIGTVFVDHRLHILRFTPSVTRIINLIQSDIGRPVGHIASNLVGYDNLVADTQAVLTTLVAKEVEVQTRAGSWYTMRIQPYRTLDNVIEGAVITFVDITDKVLALELLRKTCSQDLQAAAMQDSRDAMAILDPEGRILAWNPAAANIYGWNKEEALSMNFHELIPKEMREEEWSRINGLAQSEGLMPHPTQRVCKDGRIVDMDMVSTDLRDKDGRMYAIATMERVRNSQSL